MQSILQINPNDILGPLNSFESKNAPSCFYAIGDLNLLSKGTKVSVIGTRNPSLDGIKRARFLVKELVSKGIVIVSGLAEGIDTIVHETAIHYGGKTIAVLGTSLNIYPKSNKELLEIIKNKHLALSQFPFDSSYQKKNFPIRNRTMALISDATIIVEAGENSGTKHQGWEALRLGRLLYLMENVVTNHTLIWPQEMISYGAQVLNKETLNTVIDNLPKNKSGNSVAF